MVHGGAAILRGIEFWPVWCAFILESNRNNTQEHTHIYMFTRSVNIVALARTGALVDRQNTIRQWKTDARRTTVFKAKYTDLAAFHNSCGHDNDAVSLFPHHLPECRDRCFQATLAGNVVVAKAFNFTLQHGKVGREQFGRPSGCVTNYVEIYTLSKGRSNMEASKGQLSEQGAPDGTYRDKVCVNVVGAHFRFIDVLQHNTGVVDCDRIIGARC